MYILLVTARADGEDLEVAMSAGANDYLTKPFDVRRINVRLSVAERHILDLQEHNQARRALQESARRTSNILEKTSDGFFSLDHDWNFTYLNAGGGEDLQTQARRDHRGKTSGKILRTSSGCDARAAIGR